MKSNATKPTAISSKKFISLLYFFIFSTFLYAQNPISTENALLGNPKSEWDISGSDDLSIQGFATQISVNTGETIDFKIDVKAPTTNFSIKIYRLGYYNGLGARLIADLGSFSGVAQPAPLYDIITGKTDCSNWSVSASWNTGTFTSGLYIAKITRADTQGASHIAFVVRNDNGNATMLFKTSDTTWQAYNGYGGNSLYVNNSGTPVSGFNHATKVSYNRPFNTRGGGGGSGSSEDWIFNAEYPMIRWLERNGYDVSYTTDVDMDKDPKQITPTTTLNTYGHKVLMSVGHDEYWSFAERTKFENARDAGVHLAFFSGNEVYWKVRWEDNHRTLVCYKEGSGGENTCGTKCDPEPTVWTGLWREGCNYPLADGCNPENSLTGQISWAEGNGSIIVPSDYKNLRFWRNTSIASLANGNSATLPYGTLGYEFDFEQYASTSPKGRITMSNTTLGGKNHKLSLYKHSSGAWVFGAGTVQWSWGLDEVHDRGNEAPSQDMQQATVNLFTDMGVSPATLQSGLTLSNPINTNAPVSVINLPSNNATVPSGTTVIISGTTSDTDGTVAGVEISIDGGITWNVASGTTSWTYSWVPSTQGSVSIKSRAFDDNGNMETVGVGINVTVDVPLPIVCPCSIFPVNSIPQSLSDDDHEPIEVGMKFRSAINGYITGIRFYKASGDTGTHIGTLWSSSGTSLATVVFSGESASGWQEATFSGPVEITANTTYIISYHSSNNLYTSTVGGLTTAVTTGNLTALADGTDGNNGVYIYSNSPAFPTQSYQASNYWVDVVFNTSATDSTPPTITQVTPAIGATLVSSSANVSATFSESINETTLASKFELIDASNNLISATVSYNIGTKTATLTPTNSLSYSTTYTAKLLAGIQDNAGNLLATDYSWTFTTSAEPEPLPIPAPDGPGGPILIISSSTNPFSRYPIEILRAEGINEFKAIDISAIDATVLANYEVAILGEISIDATQATMLETWVNTGKTLITLKPDADIYSLLGIASASGQLSDKYLLFNTISGAGVGLVDQTIQYHSTADLYTLSTTNTPTVLATLYTDATTASSNPAVISRNVGTGKVFAFAYDLAKSVVYTRQGNPAWAGQQRDDQNDGNIRSNDLYTGTEGNPDWIDFNKVQIPQADEQQRLLSNIITQSILPKMPLPKFWFLPRKLKAAVVMTGDDHGNNGTAGRFDYYLTKGNNTAADVLDWKAIRSTSYIYESTPLSNAVAATYEAQGFEIALHLNSGCNVYTYASLQNSFTTQLAAFNSKYTSLPATITHRTHCISWSDWSSKPKVEIENDIHLNTDYYYWPASWVQDRPGMFTGSGMPMRYADLNGTILDNYQVTTQMPDESGLNVANFINTLLDNAKGTKGYYGVFCANMHTDNNNPGDQSVVGSNAIVASAIAHEIPVISAKQMLTWLDGRNASTYSNISFTTNTLTFDITQASGAHKLQGMLPVASSNGQLLSLQLSGSPVSYTTEIIKGINYAFFDATTGSYTATYGVDNTPPTITNVVAMPNPDGTATITWITDEPATSSVDYGTTANSLNLNSSDVTLKTSHSIILNGLSQSTPYYFNVTSADATANSTTQLNNGNPFQFTTPTGPCVTETSIADFTSGTLDANTMIIGIGDGGVSLKTALYEEFLGTSTPTGWTSANFNPGGTTYNNGQVTVNGTHIYTNTSFGPGTTIEFEATFNSGVYQNVGFSNDQPFNLGPWITIGQGDTANGNLYARSSSGTSISLGSNLLGSAHKYKIVWNSSSFDFYVDGSLTPNATIPLTVATNMFIQISDVQSYDGALSVDWIHTIPFSSSGTYTSQIFDAVTLKSWQEATWNTTVPSGTTITISQRQANTSGDITTATWNPIPTNGIVIGGVSQFIQYKVDFATSNTNETPVLLDISFACTEPPLSAPLITTQPTPQTVCLGSEVSFTSVATGNPIPTVQWQKSIGSTNVWADISGAITSTYTFTPLITDNDTKYRAIWTNTQGTVTSNAVLLTVNPALTATLGALKNPICPGEAIQLQLTDATGSGPFTVVVNGETYNNVDVNVPFESINPSTTSIWENTSSVGLNSNDNSSLEIGVKFKSSTSGYITGIKFYKFAENTGTHTGTLWSASGTSLATITFSNETASGWQETLFSTPIFIQANTTYTASYHTTTGYYAVSSSFFDGNQNATNASLTALSSTEGGPNGVFQYGVGGIFPNSSYNNSNYWVDVLFSEANPSATYNLTSITNTVCTNTNNETPLSTVTIITAPLPDGTISATTPNVCEGSPVNLTFDATAGTEPFDLVINGTTYSNVKSGEPFETTTATNTAVAITIWPDTFSNLSTGADTPVVLGLKFISNISGTISKIRFYQPHTNSNISYIGTLWDNSSNPLTSATYVSDGNSGWKEIVFSSPVAIVANTTYMASYLVPASNNYAYTTDATLTIPHLSGSITAESSHYLYSSSIIYPTNDSSANYLVDVVFTPTSSMNFNLTSITSATGCTKSVNSNTTVTVGATTTWNGMWSNGLPDSSKGVIFQTDYTITSDFTACSIKVMNNADVVVNSGFNVILNGAITVDTGSTFALSNTANLLQSDSNANNSGNIIVTRDSNPLMRLDYTMWSSPVDNQNLFDFSSKTIVSRFYRFDTAGGLNGVGEYKSLFPTQDQATYSFEDAKGYLIRMPDNHPTTATIWPGIFTGKPHNGDITIPLVLDGNKYNAVGNPYPSKIDISKFATDNASTIEQTIYYWRKTNNAANPSYCTFNIVSNTYGDNGQAYTESPIDPLDSDKAFLQIGQGFIVQAKPAATSLVFNNTQRSDNNNNQFFKMSGEKSKSTSETEAHRFWLNMTGNEAEFSQTVVGYFTNAKQGLEDYDSKYFNDGPIALMSVINSTDLVIQGRAVPFNITDVVPLKYKTTTAGNYTIAIDHVDGLFTAEAQTIYIKDNLTSTTHNLTDGAFTFTTTAGTFDNRFEIVYQDVALNTNIPTVLENQVVLYYQDDSFIINSGNLEMKKIKVFDLRGRLIAVQKSIYAKETKIKLSAAKQVFLIEVTTVNDEIVIKKAAN